MTLLWPRLELPVAQKELDGLRSLDLDALRRGAATIHPAQRFASTGGGRASSDDLAQVRDVIIAAAQRFGYPDEAPASQRVLFDRYLAPRLYEAMPMPVGEALTRAVWNFTTVVLAPDVTSWRFGRQNTERWLCSDRTRHMFSRLWWQAAQLTSEGSEGRETELLDGLTESDLNQMLERTAIGGYRPLVTALASAVLALGENDRSRGVVREASLRLLRLTAVVDPYGLSAEQLRDLVGRAVEEALAVTRSVGPFATVAGARVPGSDDA